MDLEIILSSISSFFLFLVMHTVVFRNVDKKKVLVWITNTCLIGSIFPFIFSVIFALFHPSANYAFGFHFFIVFIFSFIFYGFLAVIYILGPFGLIESSIRFRLLEEIAKRGKDGIDKNKLYKAYNKHVIIQKRLDRFVLSKDIVYRDKCYIFQNRFSYFIIQTFLFENMKKIYMSDKEMSIK
jgi:hypothetical protein